MVSIMDLSLRTSIGSLNYGVVFVSSGDAVVNEDDSGDGILFENDDQWVTE